MFNTDLCTGQVGVILPYQQGRHPIDKLVVRGGRPWCTDLLDVFVRAGQSVASGDQVGRGSVF